jgi:hypothetical protein
MPKRVYKVKVLRVITQEVTLHLSLDDTSPIKDAKEWAIRNCIQKDWITKDIEYETAYIKEVG